jgi:hypothetical protein
VRRVLSTVFEVMERTRGEYILERTAEGLGKEGYEGWAVCWQMIAGIERALSGTRLIGGR